MKQIKFCHCVCTLYDTKEEMDEIFQKWEHTLPPFWFKPIPHIIPKKDSWPHFIHYSLHVPSQQYHIYWSKSSCFFYSPIQNHLLHIDDPSFYQLHPFHSSISCGIAQGNLIKVKEGKWILMIQQSWIPTYPPISTSSIIWIPNPFTKNNHQHCNLFPWFYTIRKDKQWSLYPIQSDIICPLQCIEKPILPIYYFQDRNLLIDLYEWLEIPWSTYDPNKKGYTFGSHSDFFFQSYQLIETHSDPQKKELPTDSSTCTISSTFFTNPKDRAIEKELEKRIEMISLDSIHIDPTRSKKNWIVAIQKEIDWYKWADDASEKIVISQTERAKWLRSKFKENGDKYLVKTYWNRGFNGWEPFPLDV